MKVFSLLTPTKPEFDDAVTNILNSHKYSNLKKNKLELIGKLKDAVEKWVDSILEKIISKPRASSASKGVSNIVLIIGLMIVIAISIIIILKLLKTIERKTNVKEILGEIIDEKTTPEGLRLKAEDFIKVGDYRQGVRYSFVALLLLMHNNNLLYLEDAKTNKEILSMLEKSCFNEVNKFKDLVNLFNMMWYGHKNLNENSYSKWQGNMTTLWNEVLKLEKEK